MGVLIVSDDQTVIQWDIDCRTDHVDDHNGPGQTPACVKAGYDRIQNHDARAQCEDPVGCEGLDKLLQLKGKVNLHHR